MTRYDTLRSMSTCDVLYSSNAIPNLFPPSSLILLPERTFLPAYSPRLVLLATVRENKARISLAPAISIYTVKVYNGRTSTPRYMVNIYTREKWQRVLKSSRYVEHAAPINVVYPVRSPKIRNMSLQTSRSFIMHPMYNSFEL